MTQNGQAQVRAIASFKNRVYCCYDIITSMILLLLCIVLLLLSYSYKMQSEMNSMYSLTIIK